MKRREFLHKGAIVVAGAAVVSSGAATVIAATPQWTAKLKAIQPHEAETLLAMARRIFPHSQLSDAVYEKVVEDLDAEASGTPEVAKLLKSGVAKLDGGSRTRFFYLSKQKQVAELEKIQDGEFFSKVRGTALESIYSNPVVWKQFGYQGPSYEFGGYLRHGFNDLNWLPDPPAVASPKA